MQSFIYKLTNDHNNGSYIGVSRNPTRRFAAHASANSVIGRAIRHFGRRAFSLDVLLCGEEQYCYEIEPVLIQQHGCIYNVMHRIAFGPAPLHDPLMGTNQRITSAFPLHPGLLLKLDVLPSRRITGVALADAIKTPRPSVTRLLNGKLTMTAGLAARIESATGYSAEVLLRMQAAHDLAAARRDMADKLVAIPRLAA